MFDPIIELKSIMLFEADQKCAFVLAFYCFIIALARKKWVDRIN